ncbi:hypothetical protein K2173_004595 [Erythroxylum novogranatense]|uniref:Ubiquitin-like domain-containing protein n=1 Tax=Erythroxylum novogranatense TaxID=1862640 RepID=A0AAV8T6F8_9ROSI|nr:hypothetical protein K2173_004595 [Erythroxylum novogranatense]
MDPSSIAPAPGPTMQVLIREGGTEHPLEIPDTSTVIELKRKIEQQLGMEVERQEVMFNQFKLHKYMQTLKEYGISNGNKIYLFRKIRIWIITPECRYRVMIVRTDTIRDLKELILAEDFFYPVSPDAMRFRVSGQNDYIDNDDVILAVYGIEENTMIHLYLNN